MVTKFQLIDQGREKSLADGEIEKRHLSCVFLANSLTDTQNLRILRICMLHVGATRYSLNCSVALRPTRQLDLFSKKE